MVHHFFSTYGLCEKVVHLHADNVAVKIRTTTWCTTSCGEFLQSRIKRSPSHSLSVGHTEFFPDAGFGILKYQFRRTKVGCLYDIAEMVRKSAKINHCQLVVNQRGDVILPKYLWLGWTFCGTHNQNCCKWDKENISLSVLLQFIWCDICLQCQWYTII